MSKEEQVQILTYSAKFIRKDKFNAIYYCTKWNGSNGIYFGAKEPEDFVMEVLAEICEGRRKCYLDDYRVFKYSVYFYLEKKMLTYFGYRKKKKNDESNSGNVFPLNDDNVLKYDNEMLSSCSDLGSEDFVADLEREELIERVIGLFDPNEEVEEIAVLEEIFEGKKRREIAEDLGIKEEEVTVIQKRIQRRINRRIDSIKKDELKNVKYN
ncbi:MAG: LuxR C-terminal-related transcriptional regulator [Candidatus Micrarchaeota archaeon]|nr:LuxR C-terminal-related transcriptional regulator [Candidatus Micrarchaeota archaeon]